MPERDSTSAKVKGERRIEPGCVDVSKREVYYSGRLGAIRPKIAEVMFMPERDFQRDNRFLELSRKLTYFDIELSKRLALGDTVADLVEFLYEGTGRRKTRSAMTHMVTRREPLTRSLVEYFRELLGQSRDPDSFSVEEAFRTLVLCSRMAVGAKEKFDLTTKVIEMCGMGGKLKEYGRSRIGDSGEAAGLRLEDVERMGNESQA